MPQSIDMLSVNLVRKLELPLPEAVTHWALASREIADLWRAASQWSGEDVFTKLLGAMDVKIQVSDSDTDRIPRSGPVLIAVNHPHGLLDGIVAGALLARVRRDFRILANSLLAAVPELDPHILPVDPFGRRAEVSRNATALLNAYRYLKRGGALIAFPAGEVSCLQSGLAGVTDPKWNSAAIELAARASAPVVPMFLHGRNGAGFQVAGLIHPALRTALLGRELVNKRTYQMGVAVGNRIRPEGLRKRDPEQATAYVRTRVYALGQRAATNLPGARQYSTRVTAPAASGRIEAEIGSLEPSALLYERGDSAVFIAGASEIPCTLEEIGRLREVTFRAAGEGTGSSIDIDRFDFHYRHLFLWNRAARQVAGAYRVANIGETCRCYGQGGLYTRTLFRYDDAFLRSISPGFELGRSFVRAEYQRQVHSLSYLWRGIGSLIARSPEVRYLFGPVSISADYGSVARELIVAYFEARRDRRWVRPHTPPRRSLLSPLMQIARGISSIGDLSEFLADLNGDGREVPVLLRHYLNLGGRVMGFNLDRSFSNALDALVVLDLHAADPLTLARYTGISVTPGGTRTVLSSFCN